MKRILGVLISSVMLAVSCLTALPVSAKEEYTEYIVPFYSDQTKQKQVVGISNKSLLKDGVVLIPLETACEIAGATIAAENDEAVVITRNYVSWCCEYKDEKNQYLLIDSNTGKGNFYKSALKCLTESSWSGTSFKYSLDYEGIINLLVDNFNQTKISCKYYDDELYVSFYDFLVMMGVDVDLINHEAINEITEFYTSMVEQYSNNEEYMVAVSEIEKLFTAGTGYEQFFYCNLGTPIDELYKVYYDYNNDLMCDLNDYYGDLIVKHANLVNAVQSYDGFTKTVLATVNLNADYEDVLVNVVSYHGDSEDDAFSKTINDTTDDIQRYLYNHDLVNSIDEIYRADSELEKAWRMQEKSDKFEPILSTSNTTDLDSSLSPNKLGMFYGALCGAMKNYAKYREMDNLFDCEQSLLTNTILCDDSMENDILHEARKSILMPLESYKDNITNAENSYINLRNSAQKVQDNINNSSTPVYTIICGAIGGAVSSAGDDLIMGVIDYAFFGGMPVCTLVNSGILFCADFLKNTIYGKNMSRIASLDDYVFLQEVAEDCFNEHILISKNAYSSFILGVKASMLAFKSTSADSNGEPNGEIPDELYVLLNQCFSANINFYNKSPDNCEDLTEMIGNNTNIFKLDPTPHLGITLEYTEKTTEPTETPSESETIDYEEIYYSYIENELLPQYGLAELAVTRDYSSNTTHTNLLGIVSAAIYDFCDDGTEELLVLTREKTDDVMSAYYLNLYQYTGSKVELLDRIETEEYSIHAGGEHGDSFEMIIAGNAVYQQLRTSRYGSSGPDANTTEYTIIDVNGYKFNKYQYSVNPVNVVDKSLNTILHHDKIICADLDFSDGCTECGLNTSITDAENAIRQKLNEIAFPYSSCTLSSENGLALNIGVNENMKICDYSSYQKFETIDYTKLRDHIATPQGADFSISSYTGRYGKDNIYVEISPVGDSEVNVSVEFQNEAKIILSGISYTGIAEQSMSFEASDYNSLNAYSIDFLEDSVHLKFHQLEYVNEIYPMDMPDTDIILPRLSTQTINRDISSWTNEMIANAINHSLQLYYADYYVLGSEIEENEYGKYVYTHHKSGEPPTPQTNYIVTWDNQDDVAYFAVDSTDSFVRFHITDFDPNYASFIPTFDISEYYGKYAAADCNLWLEITESENSNAEIFITFCNDLGSKVSESWFTGSVKANPFTFTADDGWGKNSYTLEFIEDEIIVSANCIECTSGLWSIPSISGAVLQKETVVINTTTWQHLCADELRNYMNSDSYSSDAMFDLLDIDNNNIPELFISEGAPHMRQVQVFTIHDQKLCSLGDYGEYGEVLYNSLKSLMWSGYFNQGHGFESHYRLENGTLVEVFSCETNSAAVMDESEAYYMINGETISKSEFETKREENTFDGWVSVGRKYPLDESTINSVLLS